MNPTLMESLLLFVRQFRRTSMINFCYALFPIGTIDGYCRSEYVHRIIYEDFFPEGAKYIFENKCNYDTIIERLEEFSIIFTGREEELQKSLLCALNRADTLKYSPICLEELKSFIRTNEFNQERITQSLYFYIHLAMFGNLPRRLNIETSKISLLKLNKENILSMLKTYAQSLSPEDSKEVLYQVVSIFYTR